MLSKYLTATVISDFNVSELGWSSGQPVFRRESNVLIGQRLINTLDSFELQQHVTEPTRENSFLDLMFISVDYFSHTAVPSSVHKCDHDMVLCKLFFANVKVSNFRSEGGYCNYKKTDYGSFAFVLEYVAWSYTFYSFVTPDDYWFALKHVILHFYFVIYPVA